MLLSAAGSMRKGFDGLAGLVHNGLGDGPLPGDMVVFITRSRVQIKLLDESSTLALRKS
jgi:transposase